MRNIHVALSMLTSIAVIACNSGGSSCSGTYCNVSPYPYPTSGDFSTMPNGFASALPSFVQTQNNGLQIAWGHNNIPVAVNLEARIGMNYGTGLCSATPINSDGVGGTWLVGAAHCFVNSKNANILTSSNLVLKNSITVKKGFNAETLVAGSAIVYLPSNYCAGSAFSELGKCPNFSPTDGVSGGQGNDIALIHIDTKFNESEVYPQIDNGDGYPTAYTMAPVLSLGYGNNLVSNDAENIHDYDKLFYVVNNFYKQSDATGYHYLYNSYFNPSAGNYGYSELVCGGDSGGGDLYWNGSNWILLSEHTYGPSDACGQFYNYLPNGATNVSAYYDWLQSIVKSSDPVADCNSGVIAGCVTNG